MFGTEGFDSTRDVLVRKDVARCDVLKHFLVGDVVCRLCCRHLDKIELNTQVLILVDPEAVHRSPGPVLSPVKFVIFGGPVIPVHTAYSGATVELPVFADPARTLGQST